MSEPAPVLWYVTDTDDYYQYGAWLVYAISDKAAEQMILDSDEYIHEHIHATLVERLPDELTPIERLD